MTDRHKTKGTRVKRRTRSAILLIVVAVIGTLLGPVSSQAATDPCAVPVVSKIACENSKPGTPPGTWDVPNPSGAIEGFTTDISANVGGTVQFKIDTPATKYSIDIYRIGYYQGNGARKIASITPSATLPQNQQVCLDRPTTGLIDCGNWAVSASWNVPADAVSGVYVATLTRTDGTAGKNQIAFVVRDDDSRSDVLFQTSDTTWQAYNNWGGNSLYEGSPAGRAYKVSYNRPFSTRSNSTEDFLFSNEYPMIRFLEANGYDVSYSSGVDSDRRGGLIKNHKTFLSVGHDEYWSGDQRANVEAARDAGVNLAFFSGNEVFWKTRWEASIDSTGTAHRTLVCYKETHSNGVPDPDPQWTGTWRDSRGAATGGGRPENGLTGTIFMVNGGPTRADSIKVPAADGKMRFWRGTNIATQAATATATLPAGTLGYEWDESLDNGARPAGLLNLSTATYSLGSDYLLDAGSSYGSGTATHHATLYRAASGALVFGAGTVQWSWGLDATHDRSGPAADTRMRQATVNLFADMGMQPATLQSGLVAAAASTDLTPPTSVISAPAAGTTLTKGAQITLTGTATDSGGVVGGVEVSIDGGTTWHPASGRASWSYPFTAPTSDGKLTVKVRAVDDSARLEVTGPSRTYDVGTGTPPPPATCPCSLWPASAGPTQGADTDTTAVELGTRFRSDVAGNITAIRFFKPVENTGIHVGHLWTATGEPLATVTFGNESASGWQQANLATPVSISANTTYVVSYYSPNGRYAGDDGYFASRAVDSPPLHAPADGSSFGANGVYGYGPLGTFPASTWGSENYFADVVLETSPDTTPPTVTGISPTASAINVATSATVSATFSEPIVPATATVSLMGPNSTPVPLVTPPTYDAASRTLTATPMSPLAASTTFSVTVRGAKDSAGNTMADRTWSFTTLTPPPPDTTPPTVTATTPPLSATNVATSTSVSATFSEPIDAAPAVLSLVDPNNAIIPLGTATYDATSRTLTAKPGSALVASTKYTATVSGAKDTSGNPMAVISWSFTTAAAGTFYSVFAPTSVPAVATEADNAAVELGMRFSSSVAGQVTAIRFYKGSTQNGGTHVGRLWSNTGTLLATVSFQNETASGWQQAELSAPVNLAAGTTYVVTYFAPQGYYSANAGYFTTARTSGVLTSPKSTTSVKNGVYRYGSGGVFPTSTYNQCNYWVDVVFRTTP